MSRPNINKNTIERHQYTAAELELVTVQRLLDNKSLTYLGRVEGADPANPINNTNTLFYAFQREDGSTFKLFAPVYEVHDKQTMVVDKACTLENALELNSNLINSRQDLNHKDEIICGNITLKVLPENKDNLANRAKFAHAICSSKQDIIPFAENTQGTNHWVVLQLQPDLKKGQIIDSKEPHRILDFLSKIVTLGFWHLSYATSKIKQVITEKSSAIENMSSTKRLSYQSITNTKDCGPYSSRVATHLAERGADASLEFKLAENYLDADRERMRRAFSSPEINKQANEGYMSTLESQVCDLHDNSEANIHHHEVDDGFVALDF